MSGVLYKQGSSTQFKLPCDGSVEVGDYVYIRPDGVLDRAQSNSLDTMPAIGKVLKKPTSSECIITDKLIDEDYTGIIPRQEFFISSSLAGDIQTSPPVSSNYVAQLIGYGFSSEKIWIDIDPTNLIVRS
jgi:hypothetical protein